jgi:drug/metabolite transporter (DMT)-like permease
MKKNYKKILYFILAILFGTFMFVYGELDDSPGGQLMGVIAAAIGVFGLIRNRKKPTV